MQKKPNIINIIDKTTPVINKAQSFITILFGSTKIIDIGIIINKIIKITSCMNTNFDKLYPEINVKL